MQGTAVSVLLEGAAPLSDLATRAALCALALRAAEPRAAIVIAIGRRGLRGDVLDRAAATLQAHPALFQEPAPGARPVPGMNGKVASQGTPTAGAAAATAGGFETTGAGAAAASTDGFETTGAAAVAASTGAAASGFETTGAGAVAASTGAAATGFETTGADAAEAAPIALDDTTFGLLEGRFEVERTRG